MFEIDARAKKEAVGYLMIGLVGAGIDFVIFYLSLFFGLPLLLSQWLGAAFGLTHNHLWHHFWLFEHNRGLGFTTPRSLGLAVLGVIVSGPLIKFLTIFLPSVFLSKILVLAFTAGSQFLIRKKWIFTKS